MDAITSNGKDFGFKIDMPASGSMFIAINQYHVGDSNYALYGLGSYYTIRATYCTCYTR